MALARMAPLPDSMRAIMNCVRNPSLHGDDIFLGTHHTFSSMAMDLRCGCSDYFRLGKTLSAAFTDTGWDVTPHAETVYNCVLADSLRKELDKLLSYLNDWSWTSHVSWYDYYTRLKMLYRTEWFAIFLGRHCEGFPTFPWDSHWPDVGRNAGQLEAFGEFIAGNGNPKSEMADGKISEKSLDEKTRTMTTRSSKGRVTNGSFLLL
jgi:hypothetical protein